ncbi:MAPEG family protein [Phaeobacter sp. HF9A]|uniref:MAPEG family protein n=1 Tax=Phaeobacter sp. HF9A TaxID=2721561 RepID=UPI001430DE0E|nr:MAPEG family protein [Phaeobacter sp. HF9A]NIZ14986.1 MAPEG family protein [Phaeobacter sp. HF9A]
MGKRAQILLGMAGGGVWGLVLIALPLWLQLPYIPAPLALPGAFVAPGLVMVAMIGFLATRRFFDDAIIDGGAFVPGSSEDIAQRVLRNTGEQLLIALLLWPFVAVTLGGAVVIALGLGFALMRLLFWIGYLLSPPLRALGFAGSFYPTVLASLWSLVVWLT